MKIGSKAKLEWCLKELSVVCLYCWLKFDSEAMIGWRCGSKVELEGSTVDGGSRGIGTELIIVRFGDDRVC